jgi:hypothetical protein
MESSEVIRWYPMRVTYHRELRIKEQLDALGVDNFVPMHYDLSDSSDGHRKTLVPAIHNLIFVHESQQEITRLKMFNKQCTHMQYMVHRPSVASDRSEIIVVPDVQMDNFIRVTSVMSDDLVYLKYTDFLDKVSQRVRVIDGNFTGAEGVIKRIKKDRVVVVLVKGVAAVAITHLPPSYLQLL